MCVPAMNIAGPDHIARTAMMAAAPAWQSMITTMSTTTSYFGSAFGVD